eukprot:SAG22_NODE_1757_length_3650_cov_2.473669_5_plen_89_part_00
MSANHCLPPNCTKDLGWLRATNQFLYGAEELQRIYASLRAANLDSGDIEAQNAHLAKLLMLPGTELDGDGEVRKKKPALAMTKSAAKR